MSDAAPAPTLEGGAYEIIRSRLATHAGELRARLEKLNAARKDVFGAIETMLIATERVTTSNNCVPRDMEEVGGNRFLFGYNVHFGLKTEFAVSDVFSAYEWRDKSFHEIPLDSIASPEFETDFRNLYKYYKNTVFVKFSRLGPRLFMVFRVGNSVTDIKTFKWLIQDGKLTYQGNRSDHEFSYLPQIEFEWKRTHRDLHRAGRHPHISIDDRLFVETVGGDLTIKVEDNTDSGEGIHSEPVDNADQTLDDAEVFYAIVGNLILLRVRPYQETAFRHFVYNEKVRQVRRIDAIAEACVLLPDDHGIIFPNGYCLQTGEFKTFESGLSDLVFERRVAAPNGEDHLYVFYNRESGIHYLMSYNLIAQKVETPITCHGFAFFENGELAYFQTKEDPQKHHVIQVWQTPYVSADWQPPTQNDSYLFKLGNSDIVRAMAECHEVLNLLAKEDTYGNLYLDLVKKTGDIIDSYFWLDKAEAFDLRQPLAAIREAASAAIEEFDKVVRLRKSTAAEVAQVSGRARDVIGAVNYSGLENIEEFVHNLAALRGVRGELITLKELRYVDLPVIEALEAEVAQHTAELAKLCVEFLLKPESLDPYKTSVEGLQARVGKLTKVAEASKVEEEVNSAASELELLIEIVSNLKIEDATQTTRIIESISAIYSTLNQVRAALGNRKRELMTVEGAAQFGAEIKLLDQAVINYLDVCDSPEKTQEYLTRAMVQLEELEARFAGFDEFIGRLAEKRDELYNAFEARKLSLVEARNKRATALAAAAERILKGIDHRVSQLDSVNDINGYFASDMMIERVHETVRQLLELNDTVKGDDIQSRLKTIREDAVRQLKDKQELFVDGEDIIRFGKHNFSVNTQPLELTTVMREGELFLHLAGTNFFERVEDAELLSTRAVWKQEMVSETAEVYRAEWLAFVMLQAAGGEGAAFTVTALAATEDDEVVKLVRQFMAPRYGEGYVKGVHDQDAARILKAVAMMGTNTRLLRYPTQTRALAAVAWQFRGSGERATLVAAKIAGFGKMRELFPSTEAQAAYIAELHELLAEFVAESGLFPGNEIAESAEYLFHELAAGGGFAVSERAAEAQAQFFLHLQTERFVEQFEAARAAVSGDDAAAYSLVRDWVRGYLAQQCAPVQYADEIAWLILGGKFDQSQVVTASVTATLTEMRGEHPVVEGGEYELDYHHFMQKLGRHAEDVVPRFERYTALKKELVDTARGEMRLEDFRPRVLTSFVRNRLIDSVFLPLIGDNLAKQIGAAGEGKRTDLMGMLLLISPPGYGKTTLMEYIANRLGVVFMKINGPAIGHAVTSLDPAEAPNASAREEMEKLSLAFEMGDNVLIYLDDIQHLNPELLQKFISLCDAQRKIEGVYKGRPRTYDFRGRKVAVVMAGNPYTESGEKFKIPDMLANRADTYNLGDIVGGMAADFESSYLENALTSNAVLQKLSSRSRKDIYAIIQMAETGSREGIDFEGNYTIEEINELVGVMKKLIRIRNVILKVNSEYIRSAAQADAYRTEPPFKLQGSYRNMNRLAEKVVPIMNDTELEALIADHYRNEAQTLTTGAEANLLKFKELIEAQTPEEKKRWEEIKQTFSRNLLFQNVDRSDPVGQVVAQLATFGAGLDAIKAALRDAIEARGKQEVFRVVGDTKHADFTETKVSSETLARIYQLIDEERARSG